MKLNIEYKNFNLIKESNKLIDFSLNDGKKSMSFYDTIEIPFQKQWCKKFKVKYNQKNIYSALNLFYSQKYHRQCFEKESCCFFTDIEIIKTLYKQIQNKKILLIGGSSDINFVDFSALSFDEVFVVNNFFLNEKINMLKPKFVLLNNEIKSCNLLRKHLCSPDTFIFKFAHDDSQSFIKKMKYKNHYVYYNARFNGCTIMNRALSLISFFNPELIYFCGFDLHPIGHALEKNKQIRQINQFELDMTFFMFKVLNDMNIRLIKVDADLNSTGQTYSIISHVFLQSI